MALSNDALSALERILGGDHDCFGTFTVTGDPSRYVQYMPGVINAAYPFSDDPSRRLATLPDFSLVEWTSGHSVTGDLKRFTSEAIAEWMVRYFRDVLGVASPYELTVKVEL